MVGETATMSDHAGSALESAVDKPPCPYNEDIEDIRDREYPMLKDAIYLDHAGTTLYSKSAIDAFSKDMVNTLYGNPHSASMSSQMSTQWIEDVRLRVLRFFNADPQDYSLVFVANATAGLKLVAESFRDYRNGYWFGYHMDSHTSLVGMREHAKLGHHCFASDGEVEDWIGTSQNPNEVQEQSHTRLLAWPAQSNMNGRRLPLSWSRLLRVNKPNTSTYSLLDAAALCTTSKLDLGDRGAGPDYTVVSFNKIFGFPDLGALIVCRGAEGPLRKRQYFGGGTVDMVTCGIENWHIKKQAALHEQLEDGTLPVHSIIALDHALNAHFKLYFSQDWVSLHCARLAQELHDDLAMMQHFNGAPVCKFYSRRVPSAGSPDQGPVVAFNIRNSRGQYISNTEVEKVANIHDIHLRSGGLCNPGGVSAVLNLAPWELKRNFLAGHRCGDETDLIEGKPTGMLRISLGAMSNREDIKALGKLISDYFVETCAPTPKLIGDVESVGHWSVESLTIYPIKSCCGFSITPATPWDVHAGGLAWDREWCIVHQGTHKILSQKRHPKMALLCPVLDFHRGVLKIVYRGTLPAGVQDEICVPLSANPNVFRRSGDVAGSDMLHSNDDDLKIYSSPQIASFLTSVLGTPCTLARFPHHSSTSMSRHLKPQLKKSSRSSPSSFANESPILVISRSSLNRLNEQIKSSEGKAAHASVFRANIILTENLAENPGRELPFAEDEWQTLQVGDSTAFDILGGCRRCQMVCIDQKTAEKNAEPFATLAKTRRMRGQVFFGVHTTLAAACKGAGATIKIGDVVRPTTRRPVS